MADRQAGCFTVEQALASGWSARSVRRRTADGDWLVVAGRGLVARGRAVTVATRAWAAFLTWPDAVASHRTAALLHGFPVDDDGCAHVITAPNRRPLPGVRPHRVPLAEVQVRHRGGLPLTDPARTATDCLAELPFEQALSLWAWVSTRRVLDRHALAEQAHLRFGRKGAAQLVRLLAATSRGAVSEAERRFHRILDRAGITGWVAGATVLDGEGRRIAVVDVLFEAERLVAEVDGYGTHASREAFVADRRRQNRLQAAGYLVLRFTWDDLVERPDQVATQLREVLRSRKTRR